MPTTIQGRLNQDSAAFAEGHKAVCLFVNDDGSAPVSAEYKASCPAGTASSKTAVPAGLVPCLRRSFHYVKMPTTLLLAGTQGSSRSWCEVHRYEVHI